VNVVKAEDIAVRYGGVEVLSGIGFHAASSDFLALFGPNGSGKTTLVKSLLGLLPSSRGSVRPPGQAAAEFDPWLRIGYVPQPTGNLARRFPDTVQEMVAAGRRSLKRFPKGLTAEDAVAVDQAMARVAILALADRRIDRLSGGQRRRVFLAPALVNDPELLILDKPTAVLDLASRIRFVSCSEASTAPGSAPS